MSRPVDLTGENSYHVNLNSKQGLLGLPKEIQELVFRYLGLKDLCEVERTCRQLRASVVDYQTIAFWTTQFKRYFGKPLLSDPELSMTKNKYGPIYRFFKAYQGKNRSEVDQGQFFLDYGLIDLSVRNYPNLQIKVYSLFQQFFPLERIDTHPSLQEDIEVLKKHLWSFSNFNAVPIREQTRIEAAKQMLMFYSNRPLQISEFGIKHQATLVEIAKTLAVNDCEALEQQIQVFGIQDESILKEFNRIFKTHHEAKTILDRMIEQQVTLEELSILNQEMRFKINALLKDRIKKHQGSFRCIFNAFELLINCSKISNS